MIQLASALADIKVKRRGQELSARGGAVEAPTGVVGLQLRGMGREKRRLAIKKASRGRLEGELKRDMEALKISREVGR